VNAEITGAMLCARASRSPLPAQQHNTNVAAAAAFSQRRSVQKGQTLCRSIRMLRPPARHRTMPRSLDENNVINYYL